MKKFLSVLVLSIATLFVAPVIVQAQQLEMSNPNGSTIDTFANTTAEGPSVRIPGSVKTASFVIELTSISGTVGGKIYLQGASRSGQWSFPYLDSVTLAAGSNNWQMSKIDPAFQYYRIWVVPTGTQSTSYRATAYIRKP
jgi:hypothetical protein